MSNYNTVINATGSASARMFQRIRATSIAGIVAVSLLTSTGLAPAISSGFVPLSSITDLAKPFDIPAATNTGSKSAEVVMAFQADRLERKFDAVANLLKLRADIRSVSSLTSTEVLRLAQHALERLQSRASENVNDWASRLGRDISNDND